MTQGDLGCEELPNETVDGTDSIEIDGIFAIVEALIDYMARRDPNWQIRSDIRRLRQLLDDDGYVLGEDGRIQSRRRGPYLLGSAGKAWAGPTSRAGRPISCEHHCLP